MAIDDDERDDVVGEAPAEVIIAPTDALRIMRANKGEQHRLIERFGGTGAPERDIELELASNAPLARPELFEAAHRRAMYAIEVLDRNGARGAKMPRLGPLKPVAGALVSIVTRWIVRGHQNSIIGRVSRLYARREVITVPGSPEFMMLRRARMQARLVEEGYSSNNPAGLPAFLVGGALVSTLASSALSGIESVFNTTHGGLVLAGIAMVILGSISWVALFSAGVARRRIRMTTDAPINELWLAIGHCGRPPRDRSLGFAIYAIVMSVVAWIAVPLVFYLVVDAVRR
jgi:hypothetical protein